MKHDRSKGQRRPALFSLWTSLGIQISLNLAYAAGGGVNFDTILGDIPATICNAANFLAGPIGAAIVILVFVIGLIRMAAGNRGGLGLIITAFVIGLVLVAAPQIVALFTGGECALA